MKFLDRDISNKRLRRTPYFKTKDRLCNRQKPRPPGAQHPWRSFFEQLLWGDQHAPLSCLTSYLHSLSQSYLKALYLVRLWPWGMPLSCLIFSSLRTARSLHSSVSSKLALIPGQVRMRGFLSKNPKGAFCFRQWGQLFLYVYVFCFFFLGWVGVFCLCFSLQILFHVCSFIQ